MEEVTTNQQKIKNVNPKAKHWCATINNYGDADICQFKNIEESATYYIFGKEVSASGTSHLQCYLSFKTQRTLATLKKVWPTAHFEIAVGTPEQASIYCKKDGNFVEFGELPAARNVAGGEATKTKWKEIMELAQKGKMDQIEPKIQIAHYHTLKQIGFDHQIQLNDLPDVCGEWIYGEPGVGKSHAARAENPGIFDKMINKWWDNYEGTGPVMLDDFDLGHDGLGHYLKRWADKYPFRGEVKCHSKMFRPTKVVVTSNYHPSEIFKGAMLAAIIRRFKIRHMVAIKKKDNLVSKKPKRKLAITQEIAVKKPKLMFNKTGELVPFVPSQKYLEPYLEKGESYCLRCQRHPCECKSVISVESDDCTTTDEYDNTSDEEEYSDDESDMSCTEI